jgi:hypothetical protein
MCAISGMPKYCWPCTVLNFVTKISFNKNSNVNTNEMLIYMWVFVKEIKFIFKIYKNPSCAEQSQNCTTN